MCLHQYSSSLSSNNRSGFKYPCVPDTLMSHQLPLTATNCPPTAHPGFAPVPGHLQGGGSVGTVQYSTGCIIAQHSIAQGMADGISAQHSTAQGTVQRTPQRMTDKVQYIQSVYTVYFVDPCKACGDLREYRRVCMLVWKVMQFTNKCDKSASLPLKAPAVI